MRQAGFQSRLPFSALRIREKTEYSAIGWSFFLRSSGRLSSAGRGEGDNSAMRLSCDRLPRCRSTAPASLLAPRCATIKAEFCTFPANRWREPRRLQSRIGRDCWRCHLRVRCACRPHSPKTAAIASSRSRDNRRVWRTASDPGRPDGPGRSSPTRRSLPMPRMTRTWSTPGSISKTCWEGCWPAAWRSARG